MQTVTRTLAVTLAFVALSSKTRAQDLGDVAGHRKPTRLVVTIGTRQSEVESVLGQDQFASIIPGLRRAQLTYSDGTEIIYIDRRVVSVTPGAKAEDAGNRGYVLKQDGAVVEFTAEVLRLWGKTPVDYRIKRQVEEDFFFAPSSHFDSELAVHGHLPYWRPACWSCPCF